MTGIQHTRHETARYKLVSTGYGFELIRSADAATAFFQGDDADLWERNMTALEAIKDWRAGNSLDASFDFLCSGYDEILRGDA